ncbi:MAG: hypothetical protein H7Y02_14425 [Candidatus Obscuribacterales bacterium]|nr:hypothetical protein [Steroidobacteraceae bacterium]
MKKQKSTKAAKPDTKQRAPADEGALDRANVLWAAARQRLRLAKEKYKGARKHFKEAKQEAKRFRQGAAKLTKLLKRAAKVKKKTIAQKVESLKGIVTRNARKVSKALAKKQAPKKVRQKKHSNAAKPRQSKPVTKAIAKKQISPKRKPEAPQSPIRKRAAVKRVFSTPRAVTPPMTIEPVAAEPAKTAADNS